MSARSAFAGSQFSHAGRPALYLVPDSTMAFSGAVAPFAAPADAYATAGSPSAVRRAHTSAQAPLRLTRRGRFVFFGLPLILLAALLLSLAGFLTAPAKAADSPASLATTPTVTVTVQPGESLWTIAGTVDPKRDPRDVVAEIVQLNNLDAAPVLPGQQLFVPTP